MQKHHFPLKNPHFGVFWRPPRGKKFPGWQKISRARDGGQTLFVGGAKIFRAKIMKIIENCPPKARILANRALFRPLEGRFSPVLALFGANLASSAPLKGYFGLPFCDTKIVHFSLSR